MPAILPAINLDSEASLKKHFTQYQVNWMIAEDQIHAKERQAYALAEKSVRIGWSFCDSYKNVRKRLLHKNRDYLFATKDYPSAIEYMRSAKGASEVFDYARSIVSHGEEFVSVPRLDRDGHPSAFTQEVKVGYIKFDNGSRILAFSSNPQAMAVYGGDVGLDEFAKHRNAQLLWETAQGRIAWGGDIAVWSAHDGEDTLFNEFAREARSGKGPWNLYYRVTMQDAIELGLVDLINKVRGTHFSPAQFLDECRLRSRAEEMFQQTYMCNPLGAQTSTLVPWSAIERCRSDYQIDRVHLEAADITALFGDFDPATQDQREISIRNYLHEKFPSIFKSRSVIPSTFNTQPSTKPGLRLGFDIASSGEGDLAAVYIDEVRGKDLWLAGLFTCRTEDWSFLKSVLFTFLRDQPRCMGAGDETGPGRQICWEAAKAFPSRFHPVNFRSKKDDLGFILMNQLAAAEKRFPNTHEDIAADYFALRRNFTGKRWVFSEGKNPFNEASHCDIAWAGALASHVHTNNRPVLTARLG